MSKKIVKMMLFVFVVCAFCSVSGQISYARKGRNTPNVQVTQKGNGEIVSFQRSGNLILI